MSKLSEERDQQNKIEYLDVAKENPKILETFDILEKIGSGTFSSVYLAQLKEKPEKRYALKFLVASSHPKRTTTELSCLINMGGKDNILGVCSCVRHLDSVVIVMPYFPYDDIKSYLNNLSVQEVRLYVKSLLTALRRVHSFDIIHRDVKPLNFLFDRKNRRFALIDFGLAQEVSQVPYSSSSSSLEGGSSKKQNEENLTPKHAPSGGPSRPTSGRGTAKCKCLGKKMICTLCLKRPSQTASRAGSRGYRPPEVLMRYVHQTTAVDVWAAGVIFLSLVSGKCPFFRNLDDMTSLYHMTEIFGSDVMKTSARAMDKSFICSPSYPPMDLRRMCAKIRSKTAKKKDAEKGIDEAKPVAAADERNVIGDGPKNDGRRDRDARGKDAEDDEKTETLDYDEGKQEADSNATLPLDESNATLPLDELELCDRDDPAPVKVWGSVKENADPTDKDGYLLNKDGDPLNKDGDQPPNLALLLPDSAFDLIKRLLDPNPFTRITAAQAVDHPFLADT